MFQLLTKKLYASLNLDRHIVGVKFLRSENEFQAEEAMIPSKKMNYCLMVASASNGHGIKARKENFLCQSGPRVLGIDPTDLKNAKGENWARLGLYSTPEISKEVREQLSYSQEDIYGVMVKPLEQYNEIPDVVLIITIPYNVMRIVQGYAYHYGIPKNINMIGNQALCLECSARPYCSDDLNVSVLCIGTRHRTGWKNEEMAVGIPKSKFENIVDGIYNTINSMESNSNKKIIEDKLRKEGILDFEIRYDYNYYLDC